MGSWEPLAFCDFWKVGRQVDLEKNVDKATPILQVHETNMQKCLIRAALSSFLPGRYMKDLSALYAPRVFCTQLT